MDFFTPCWIILSALFPAKPSTSYIHKVSSTIAQRISVCREVARVAHEEKLNPILVIALAFNESKFTRRKDPLLITSKYKHICRGSSPCKRIHIGVNVFKQILTSHEGDLCESIAHFSGGPNGRCLEGRREFIYAARVIDMFESLCAKVPDCQISEGTRRPSSSNF